MKNSIQPTFTNVRADYIHEPRIVKPLGFILTRDSCLKFYSMMKKDNVSKRDIEFAKRIIKDSFENRTIKRYSGTGFGILSEDVLNVARWDVNYPTLLMQDIYTYQNRDLRTAKLADVRETGSFCIWELYIVNHEKDVWERFLASNRNEEDKITYLEDFIARHKISIPSKSKKVF